MLSLPTRDGNGRKIHVFDAANSKLSATTLPDNLLNQSSNQLYPTEFGWLANQGNQILALDLSGKELLGRVVSVPHVSETQGADSQMLIPRWVLGDGTMKSGVTKEGLYMVYCKDNRAYCEPLSDFEKDPTNPPLPVVETIPFLETNEP